MSRSALPRLAALALLAAVPFTAGVARADEVTGDWRMPVEGGAAIVELSICGNLICGSVNGLEGGASSPAVGTQVVAGMEPRGAGQYRDGQVFDPSRGRMLPGRLELQGSRLAVNACQMMACREQIWQRAR